MKQFEVDIDITMSKRIYIDAENEDEAREKVEQRMKENPYEQASDFDAYVSHEITDVNETEPDDDLGGDLREALAYVREQLGEDRLAVVKAQACVCYEQRRPIDTDYNDEVHDLLEEYGADNDLPEGWWENEGDIDDWLLKL